MAGPTVRAPEHPPHVWEAQRPYFTKLYKDERRKLDEVQRLMPAKHGFYATQRQYKRKIKQWDLEKNCKAIEKSQALMKLKISAINLDMTSVYKVNGKDIAAHKLVRYARARGREKPSIVRNAAKLRCHMPEAPSNDTAISIAFWSDYGPVCGEPSFVDLHELLSSTICFIWFETWDSVESLSPTRSALSLPKPAFLEWTKTVLRMTGLNTTHVTLAVLYVYRLKWFNPTVVGKDGSEYRLTVVALMLANKFLNDYFYLNKTWAEVSGISLQEVNIMEMEFLSNMRYSLMVSPRNWKLWMDHLGQIHEFLRRPQVETPRITELSDMLYSDVCTDPPEVLNTEGHNSLPSSLHEVPDLDMPNTSDPAVEIILDLGKIIDARSESQYDANIALQDISNDSFRNLEFTSTCVSDSIPDSQMIDVNHVDDNVIVVFDDIAAPLVYCARSLPTPLLQPMDTLLYWKAIDWPKIQEGPIPDLEMYLESSLWDDGEDSFRLDWNTIPLLEQGDTAKTLAEQDKRGNGKGFKRDQGH